jgi:endonuclease YncB( thermonuclease family)
MAFLQRVFGCCCCDGGRSAAVHDPAEPARPTGPDPGKGRAVLPGPADNDDAIVRKRADADVAVALQDAACDREEAARILEGATAAADVLSLAGFAGWGRVVDVYDGDTCTVVMCVPGFGFRRLKIRVQGIDSPEMKGGSLREKEAAVCARDFLISFLVPDGGGAGSALAPGASRAEVAARLGQRPVVAWVTCGGMDKYGRVLGDLRAFPRGPPVSEAMLRAGHAVPYDGGAKAPFGGGGDA